MDRALKRATGLYLTGFMGSGKTTAARLLAEHLGWDFIDVDAEIEARENSTIAEIFETRGEAEFRRIETETIEALAGTIGRGVPFVAALGGGAFVQPDNCRLLENRGISIWLDCPLEAIEKRLSDDATMRPLARDRAAMRRLYEERREGYGRACYTVNADCEVESVVEKILALPFWKQSAE
jgi:shikimate kinase